MIINELNRIKIDLFLKQLQLISKTKPFPLGVKHIYNQIISQSMPEQEIREDLSQVFDSLIEANKNNPQMDVFVAYNWPYFCQFKSSEAYRAHDMNPIKIYIPLKKSNMQASVQKIFDFINQNNIHHCSKLARETRIDDLVIRVFSKEDADKIITFVNNDNELKRNMYESNPFTIADGKVGLAMDRIVSYNDTVAKYIHTYIKKVNENSQIASITGFKNFLQENLKQMKEKGDLSLQISMCSGKDFQRLPMYLQTIEEVTELLIKVVEGKAKDALFDEFDRVNNPNYIEEQQRNYQQFDYVEMQNNNRALLSTAYTIMASKYGTGRAISNLMKYKNTGDLNFITRDFDLRTKIEDATSFRTYLNTFDLEKYLNSLSQPKQQQEPEASKETILEEVCKSTYIACQTPERDYCGKTQVARALICMMGGDFNCITRTDNARNIAKKNIHPLEIRKIVKKTLEENGYIIENEADLYELYATHIEHVCQEKLKERSR